jgi:RNA polymerase sigma-70 factor (ECF subfamily)
VGPEVDEHILIERATGGDVAAFERLYHQHVGRVYGLCIRISGNQAEAEDCTQETFIKAWQRLADFGGRSRLSTWLHRIAVNEVLSRKRKVARDSRHLSVVEREPERAQTDVGTLQDLERAIGQLPDRAREVFVLTRIYGYTHEETGSMLGIAAGTSKAQLHRAVKLLEALVPLPGASHELDAANGHTT